MDKRSSPSSNRHLRFAQAIIGGTLIIYGAIASLSSPAQIVFLFLGLIPFAMSILDTI